MGTLKKVIVLNALQDNAADAYVDSNGYLQITGAPEPIKARNVAGKLTRTPYNAETAGVVTVTFTSQNSYSYSLTVTGQNNIGGGINTYTRTITVTSAASATATLIGDQFRAIINADPNFNITASGTTTLVLTADAGYPIIYASNPLSDSNISIAATTPGVSANGLGSTLTNLYAPTTAVGSTIPMYGSFTSSAHYTQWEINYISNNNPVGPSNTSFADSQILLFINESATSSGSNTAAMNLAWIQGTDYTYADSIAGTSIYLGTLPALQKGYRAVVTSPATTTCEVTVTTGALTLSGGSATFSTLDAALNDSIYISASGGTAFTTHKMTTIKTITSTTAGTGTYLSAVTGAVFKIYQLRALPF